MCAFVSHAYPLARTKSEVPSMPIDPASGEDSTVLSPERSVSPQQGHLDLLVIEKGEK